MKILLKILAGFSGLFFGFGCGDFRTEKNLHDTTDVIIHANKPLDLMEFFTVPADAKIVLARNISGTTTYKAVMAAGTNSTTISSMNNDTYNFYFVGYDAANLDAPNSPLCASSVSQTLTGGTYPLTLTPTTGDCTSALQTWAVNMHICQGSVTFPAPGSPPADCTAMGGSTVVSKVIVAFDDPANSYNTPLQSTCLSVDSNGLTSGTLPNIPKDNIDILVFAWTGGGCTPSTTPNYSFVLTRGPGAVDGATAATVINKTGAPTDWSTHAKYVGIRLFIDVD